MGGDCGGVWISLNSGSQLCGFSDVVSGESLGFAVLGKFVAVCDYRVKIGFSQGLECWVRVLGDTGDSSVLCNLANV